MLKLFPPGHGDRLNPLNLGEGMKDGVSVPASPLLGSICMKHVFSCVREFSSKDPAPVGKTCSFPSSPLMGWVSCILQYPPRKPVWPSY